MWIQHLFPKSRANDSSTRGLICSYTSLPSGQSHEDFLLSREVLTKLSRTVKMSILALYYRIGSGMRGLPFVVQAPAVWVTAGLMTAAAIASFMVGENPFDSEKNCLPNCRRNYSPVCQYLEHGISNASRRVASTVHFSCKSRQRSMLAQTLCCCSSLYLYCH
jgi:hypothetical protein